MTSWNIVNICGRKGERKKERSNEGRKELR